VLFYDWARADATRQGKGHVAGNQGRPKETASLSSDRPYVPDGVKCDRRKTIANNWARRKRLLRGGGAEDSPCPPKGTREKRELQERNGGDGRSLRLARPGPKKMAADSRLSARWSGKGGLERVNLRGRTGMPWGGGEENKRTEFTRKCSTETRSPYLGGEAAGKDLR